MIENKKVGRWMWGGRWDSSSANHDLSILTLLREMGLDVCCEYVLSPLVKKEVTLAYGSAE